MEPAADGGNVAVAGANAVCEGRFALSGWLLILPSSFVPAQHSTVLGLLGSGHYIVGVQECSGAASGVGPLRDGALLMRCYWFVFMYVISSAGWL